MIGGRVGEGIVSSVAVKAALGSGGPMDGSPGLLADRKFAYS